MLNWREGSYESIALPRYGLHEAGVLRVIAEDLTDLADGGVDAVLGVHKDFAVPQALDYFGSGDEMAIPGCQQNEQLHRFSFQLEAAAPTGELKAVAIHLEVAEFKDSEGHRKAPRG